MRQEVAGVLNSGSRTEVLLLLCEECPEYRTTNYITEKVSFSESTVRRTLKELSSHGVVESGTKPLDKGYRVNIGDPIVDAVQAMVVRYNDIGE